MSLKEKLKELFGDAYTDAIDKTVGEMLAKETVPKAVYAEATGKIATLEAQATDYDKQLEELKNSTGDIDTLKAQIETLQSDNAAEKAKYDAQIDGLQLEALIDTEILTAKARSPKAVKAYLDIEKLKESKNRNEDIKAAIKALGESEETAFLFEAPPATPPAEPRDRIVSKTPGTPPSDPAPVSLRDAYAKTIAAKALPAS